MLLPFSSHFSCCSKELSNEQGFETIEGSDGTHKSGLWRSNVAQFSWTAAGKEADGSIILSESTDTSVAGEEPSAFPVRISSNPTVIEIEPEVHVDTEDPTSMRELLARFVHRGMQGVDCDVLHEEAGSWSRGSYCIDRALQSIAFASGDCCTTVQFRQVTSVEVEKLEFFKSVSDDGEAALVPPLVHELTTGQLKRLISLTYEADTGVHCISFLEATEQDSINFKSCASIMCHYMTNQIIAVERSEGRCERRTKKVMFNLSDDD